MKYTLDPVTKKRLNDDLEWIDTQLKTSIIPYLFANGVLFGLVGGLVFLLIKNGWDFTSMPIEKIIYQFGWFFIGGMAIGLAIRQFLLYKRKQILSKLEHSKKRKWNR